MSRQASAYSGGLGLPGDDGEAVLLARAGAWLVANRQRAAWAHRACLGTAHPDFGDGSWAGAAAGLPPALVAAAQSPALGVIDPTRGALYAHHHRDAPAWARPLTATALIGPFLFLASPR